MKTNLKVFFVSLTVFFVLLTGQVLACPTGTRGYVDTDATGAGTGESWINAYTTLQDALACTGLTEIWVAEGVYYPDEGGSATGNDTSATFQLRNNLSVYGGFSGNETELTQRDYDQYITVLSGDIQQDDTNLDGNFIAETWSDIQGSNSERVVFFPFLDSSSVLDGFTVTAGKTTGFGSGAGVSINGTGANPTLRHLTIQGNYSANDGGGMLVTFANPLLQDILFQGNHAANTAGGGLVIWNGAAPVLHNVRFIGNTCTYSGGAIHIENGSPELVNVYFSNNRAGGIGGGLHLKNGSATLINTVFSGNDAGSSGGGD